MTAASLEKLPCHVDIPHISSIALLLICPIPFRMSHSGTSEPHFETIIISSSSSSANLSSPDIPRPTTENFDKSSPNTIFRLSPPLSPAHECSIVQTYKETTCRRKLTFEESSPKLFTESDFPLPPPQYSPDDIIEEPDNQLEEFYYGNSTISQSLPFDVQAPDNQLEEFLNNFTLPTTQSLRNDLTEDPYKKQKITYENTTQPLPHGSPVDIIEECIIQMNEIRKNKISHIPKSSLVDLPVPKKNASRYKNTTPPLPHRSPVNKTEECINQLGDPVNLPVAKEDENVRSRSPILKRKPRKRPRVSLKL